MRVLRYPFACEQCFSAFKGVVEIELKIEGEDDGEYYLDIRQTAKLDWGICPRCEKVDTVLTVKQKKPNSRRKLVCV